MPSGSLRLQFVVVSMEMQGIVMLKTIVRFTILRLILEATTLDEVTGFVIAMLVPDKEDEEFVVVVSIDSL